jgi:hypothetical protein
LSTNPAIQGRQNALIEKLNNIARLNAEHGARAEGGSGAPVVPAEPAASGGSRVLPPAPVPITPEEEARLQAEFDRDWGNQQQGTPMTKEEYDREFPNRVPARAFMGKKGLPTRFAAIDLFNNQVVGDNGVTYPFTEKESAQFQTFGYNVMVREIQKQVESIAQGLGIKLVKAEEKKEEQKEDAPPASES